MFMTIRVVSVFFLILWDSLFVCSFQCDFCLSWILLAVIFPTCFMIFYCELISSQSLKHSELPAVSLWKPFAFDSAGPEGIHMRFYLISEKRVHRVVKM